MDGIGDERKFSGSNGCGVLQHGNADFPYKTQEARSWLPQAVNLHPQHPAIE